MTPLNQLQAGQKVLGGRFELVSFVASGGMGVVWQAKDLRIKGNLVALKFLKNMGTADNPDFSELASELAHSRGLGHPNIVMVYDLHEDEKERLAAISMEFVPGETKVVDGKTVEVGLTLEMIKRREPCQLFFPDDPRLMRWLTQVAAAIDYAHAQRKVHRDLKPRNILVSLDGIVKVTDLGVADTLKDTAKYNNIHTPYRRRSGFTVGYASPQQVRNAEADKKDDVHAFGVTIYELLTGRAPFAGGDTALVIHRVLYAEPELMSEFRGKHLDRLRKRFEGESRIPDTVPPIPRHWERTVRACLAKAPGMRPESLAAVVRCLQNPEVAAELLDDGGDEGVTVPLDPTLRAIISPPCPQQTTATQPRVQEFVRALKPVAIEALPDEGSTIPNERVAVTQRPNPTTVTEEPRATFGEKPEIEPPLATVEEPKLVLAPVVQEEAQPVFTPAPAVQENGKDLVEAKKKSKSAPPTFPLPGDRKRARIVMPKPGVPLVKRSTPKQEIAPNVSKGSPPPSDRPRKGIRLPMPGGKLGTPVPVPVPAIAPLVPPESVILRVKSATEPLPSPDGLSKTSKPGEASHSDETTPFSSKELPTTRERGIFQAPIWQWPSTWTVAACLLAIAVATSVGVWLGRDDAPKTGDVIILTEPSGAAITIDGILRDTSPATFPNMASGNHSVVAELAGHETATQTFTSRGGTTLPTIQLVRAKGHLIVTSEPSETNFTVDGREHYFTPKNLVLPAGRVKVSATRSGWPAQTLEAIVESRQEKQVHFTFPGGGVSIQSTPAGAEVYQENLVVGTTPLQLSDVPPGDRRYTLKLAGFKTVDLAGRIEAGETLNLISKLERERPTASTSRWTNSLGMDFVTVPGVGALVAATETRHRDFEAFVKENPELSPTGGAPRKTEWDPNSGSWREPGFIQTADHPVVCVSFEDAQKFCDWLTVVEQRNGNLAPVQRYRLPTDAEWSMCAGEGRFPWGEGWPPAEKSINVAGREMEAKMPGWSFASNYLDDFTWTNPVTAFKSNSYGLFGMGDNVSEWCQTTFRGDFRIPSLSPERLPAVEYANFRVARGGSWTQDQALTLQSVYRWAGESTLRTGARGFRCLLQVEPAAKSAGTVIIDTDPPGAKIFEGMLLRGQTPKEILRVKPGSVSFTVQFPTGTKGNLSGFVKAGESLVLVQQLGWTNSLGMRFVEVPGLRGVRFSVWETRVKDFRAFKEKAAYKVPSNAFTLDKDGFKKRERASWEDPGFPQQGNHPVCCISYEDAIAFCKWLTDVESKAQLLSPKQRYRLPTDAEWSVAAGTAKYPWGDQLVAGMGNFAGGEVLGSKKWWAPYRAAEKKKRCDEFAAQFRDPFVGTCVVGSFLPNSAGIYDLGGNVWEVCDTVFRSEMNSPAAQAQYDLADDGGKYRTLRGGSWYDQDPMQMELEYRDKDTVTRQISNSGFRCVLESAP